MYDSLNMHSLESSLIDIMRAEQDPMKSKTAFPFLSTARGGEGRSKLSDHVHQGGDRPDCSQSCVVFPHTSLFSPLLRA